MTHSFLAARRLRRRAVLTGAAAALALPTLAQSQADYPSRPVKILVPFGAGGLTDNLTRLYANELSARLGQPFVLDFKPGASTNIAASALAQAQPDGHTLFVATMASNSLNKWTYKNLGYDADRFVPVGMMAVNTFYVVVRPDAPWSNVADLVKAARESPKGLAYGSHGLGGVNHMVTELFRQQAGIPQLVHVPYKGPESHVDLMAGRIDFMIDGAAVHHVQAGKLRALAVAFPRRWPTQPQVPTMAEAGYPDVTVQTYFGFSAPAGTPAPIADRLNAAMRSFASHPDAEQRLLAMNMLPQPMGRAEMAEFMAQQSQKWGPVLRSLNINFG